jgi:nickel-dependent lactate racemase
VQELLIPYGREKLPLQLPAGVEAHVIAGRPMPPLERPEEALRVALANPLGRPALRHMAKAKPAAMIVVADYTRYNAYDVWLPELLRQLKRAGLEDGQITFYVGSGTHRPMTDTEKREYFGEALLGRYKFLDHDCDNAERMVKAGRTDYGTVLYVDERVYKSELLIVTGGIQYHYFAGYTGGRKAILPGVAGRESILKNHSLAYDGERGGFAVNVLPGVAVGNPVSEDMHEAASMVRPDLCINVVLNAGKQLCWIGAGDHGYVHRMGAAFLDLHNRPRLAHQADVAIIGAGGNPKDLTLFQAHKSLRHSVAALKPGATVLWAAQCSQGEGPPAMAGFRGASLDEGREKLTREFSMGSLCSFSLLLLGQQYQIHMVTELDADIVRGWGFTPHASLDAALERALPPRARELAWAVGPDMCNLLPELAPAAAAGPEQAEGASSAD